MKRLGFCLIVAIHSCFGQKFETTITNSQAGCIETILYSLSEKSTTSLMLNAYQLRLMGKEIDSVPPLEFLFYVLKKPYLIKYMTNTKDRFFQWSAFISGFSEKCNKEKVYEKIKQDLEVFSFSIEEKKEDLAPYVEKRDWKGLVKYLLKGKVL